MGSKRGVSLAPLMVLLCTHRHQHGRISRHAGTLRSVYLTPDGYDGPVAWEIEMGGEWFEVARESTPGVLEPLNPQQERILHLLAEMDL
jgi:hypothetical protein